jgi:16S rRNA (cytidine1402-2'-O)-methyltransferase
VEDGRLGPQRLTADISQGYNNFVAGTLFVVATPIGHLDDISMRALRVLGEVTLVAAEDTRRSGNLLRHFGLSTPLVSCHAHNEGSRAPRLIEQLLAGKSIALVSDAGTPGISDPGAELVQMARAAGVRVEAIPGPSAVAAAVSAAGLGRPGFAFLGFPPVKGKDRKNWFDWLNQALNHGAVVCFEAPHRIRTTLEELQELVTHPIIVFRELTKLHEETLEGTPEAISARLTAPQGEFTVVIPARPEATATADLPSDDTLRAMVAEATAAGAHSPREAARLVADKFGLSTKFVYNLSKDT